MTHRRKDIKEELQEIGPDLARLDAINPYQVPVGYFNNLAEIILSRVKNTSAEEELESISPLLSGLKKTTPFSVPQGYFENLKATPATESARVISLPARNFMKYAAAAITIGLITVLAWFFIQSPKKTNNQYAVNKDTISEKQIEKKIGEISDKEIATYLNNSSIDDAANESTADLKDEDVQVMLANVSDQDLEKYLEQNHSPKAKLN